MTTVQDIRRWLEEGELKGHNWLIVVCDGFSYEDYPVYADTTDEFYEKYENHDGKNMQVIMESYNINGDWDEQLKMFRCHTKPL